MTTSTKYTYFVKQDFPNKIVSTISLTSEINSSNIVTKLETIEVIGDVCNIWFVNILSVTDNNTLDNLVATHQGIAPAQIVKIKEEEVETGGYFKVGVFEIDAPQNSTTIQEFSFDYPVNMITARLVTGSEHTGDCLTWAVSPNTTIGVITQDYVAETVWTLKNYAANEYVWYQASGATHGKVYKCILNTINNEIPTNKTYWTKQNTTLNVSSTVISYIKVGFNVNLTDGINSDNIGDVIEINSDTSTIIVNGAPQHNYNDTSPTYVQMSILYMDNVKLGPPMNYPIGEAKIGSSYVPAGTIIQSKYINNSNVDKKLFAYIEYLY